MARKTWMGGPDMPRPGTPAAMAMQNERTGASPAFGYDPDERVAGAPPPRSAPITIAPPRRRPTSGVIPVASLPAEPRPITQPNPMGRPDPVPMTVLQRAQMARPLSATPDRSPVSGVDLASFRANYRATHKARLTPAQEALMARYLYDQNPNNVLFGDPQTLGLGR
jgi:hypothetical protein